MTIPIIKEQDGVDKQLQQNISDLIYAVFYSTNSTFRDAYRKGYIISSLEDACRTELRKTIALMQEMPVFVIRKVTLVAVQIVDDAVSVTMDILGPTGSIQQNIILNQAII